MSGDKEKGGLSGFARRVGAWGSFSVAARVLVLRTVLMAAACMTWRALVSFGGEAYG